MIQPKDFQYRILKDEEDYKKIVIEKSGIKGEFTIEKIEAHEDYLNKAKTEVDAKIKLEEAKVSNVEEHHAFVKDLTDEQIFTVALYGRAKAELKMAKEKELEIATALLDYAVEKSYIIETLGLLPKIEELQPTGEPIIAEVQPNAENKEN
jgi:hypothetical protein